MLSAHAAGNRVPRGDRLVVRETSMGGVEALRLTALTHAHLLRPDLLAHTIPFPRPT
jgi:hypothetical protein